ncbi:hypothetical protein M231_00118 [Tremella mesenterica]|uniref:GRIP domain-containing protein n=1 Tax=Tremella mesenterica TaxID=5217 RepID=A0A4Q1BWL8_TREME|nr:hypothetical protein M231_00118 [Tremella mesenterica]
MDPDIITNGSHHDSQDNAHPPSSPPAPPSDPETIHDVPPLAGPSTDKNPMSPPSTAQNNMSPALTDTPRSSMDISDRTGQLESQLLAVRQEKDVLQAQYRALLGKLTAMRQGLGEKLKEDAEELDRRENTINSLISDNATLQNTISTLEKELVSASQESQNLQNQIQQLRSQSDSSSSDVLSLTREMRELRGEMERLRVEREEWETEASKERERREATEEEMNLLERRERDMRREWERAREELEMERERARNLQEVLGEFQAAKDSELRQATTELETQLRLAATSLSEFKLRAANAETRLSEVSNDALRASALELDVREKNKTIAKLRHEAVVNNEHLTEALRRLRKNQSSDNVDRRLVTNILLSFLTTSRHDSKRFEMLSILSTILSWDDTEREKAGLQRIGKVPTPKTRRKDSGQGSGRSAEEEAAMNESFSNLFVEFLLKEASQGQPSRPDPNPQSGSPLRSPPPNSVSYSPPVTGTSTPFSRPRRLSSSSSVSAMTDRPPGLPMHARQNSISLTQALRPGSSGTPPGGRS